MTIEELLEEIRPILNRPSDIQYYDKRILEVNNIIDQAIARSREKCVWLRDKEFGDYKTSCGKTFHMRSDFETCPFCSKRIEEPQND